MVGRGAQGQPWTLQEMAERGAEAPEPGAVVAELIRFMREVEREMGDRAASFLRKFYGWYLRGMPDAKSVKPELTSAPTVAEAEAALLRSAPRRATAWPGTRPSSRSSPTRTRPAARPPHLDLRRRVGVPAPGSATPIL